MSVSKTKVPRKGVLLLGSGYGALKVAEDVAQAGIPVVWVTRAQHFLELPQGLERDPEWPEDLDFQFRPLYLRVTRHPLVTTLTQARVRSLEKTEDGCRVVVEQDPIYVDYDLCTGCSRCMEVCPLEQQDRSPSLEHRPIALRVLWNWTRERSAPAAWIARSESTSRPIWLSPLWAGLKRPWTRSRKTILCRVSVAVSAITPASPPAGEASWISRWRSAM